jgi:hypothetical protein
MNTNNPERPAGGADLVAAWIISRHLCTLRSRWRRTPGRRERSNCPCKVRQPPGAHRQCRGRLVPLQRERQHLYRSRPLTPERARSTMLRVMAMVTRGRRAATATALPERSARPAYPTAAGSQPPRGRLCGRSHLARFLPSYRGARRQCESHFGGSVHFETMWR